MTFPSSRSSRALPAQFIAWSLAFLCVIAPLHAIAAHALSARDIAWLNRITYGVNSAVAQRYQQLGKERFLEEQLSGKGAIPRDAEAAIARLGLDDVSAENIEHQYREAVARAASLPPGLERRKVQKEIRRRSLETTRKTVQRDLLIAAYSPAQLNAQMTWFWLNHFNVYGEKSSIGWTIADYSTAVRAGALGNFRDLVLLTLKHPAMLRYLDNAKNVRGKINENYARELMELHTVGVDAGYTQQDVQQLARVLTGAGLPSGKSSNPKQEKAEYYIREGAFEFNPGRHEQGDKLLLGRKIPKGGFSEVEAAVDILVTHPACANFIARKLALYWIGEDASDDTVASTAKVFSDTKGDIRRVLQHLLQSKEFEASLERPRYKDPYRFMISSLRLAYDDVVPPDTEPPAAWLKRMAYSPFSRATPDGYPLKQRAWTGSSALMTRFDVAQALASGALSRKKATVERKRSTTGEGKSNALNVRSTDLFEQAMAPVLTEKTWSVLKRARNPGEATLMLLASPEFNSGGRSSN